MAAILSETDCFIISWMTVSEVWAVFTVAGPGDWVQGWALHWSPSPHHSPVRLSWVLAVSTGGRESSPLPRSTTAPQHRQTRAWWILENWQSTLRNQCQCPVFCWIWPIWYQNWSEILIIECWHSDGLQSSQPPLASEYFPLMQRRSAGLDWPVIYVSIKQTLRRR